MTTESDTLHNGADGENDLNKNTEENLNETSENQKAEQQPVDEKPTTETEPSVPQQEQHNDKPEEAPAQPEETFADEENEKTVAAEETVVADELPSQKTESAVEEEPESTVDSDDKTEDYKHEDAEDENQEQDEEEQEVVPFKNYEELPLAVLIGEAKELLKNHPARILKEHFNQIREAVKKILEDDEGIKREAFVENGGDPLDFQYDNPARREFNSVYADYKNQLDHYYKQQEKLQQENLTERLQIIEELKSLYLDSNDDNTNIFSRFRKLKTRWHNAGMVPKSQAGNIFRTYFHHLDNFYKYLDLNKELREMDYSHNLEVRYSIINRAEELVKENNVQKALNELQYLHKLWKEEAVPVAEEMREPTWQKFKELTLKIHERKAELSEKIKEEQEINFKKKQEILDQIRKLYDNSDSKSHNEWQNGIKKLNKYREEFITIGRVPREFNQKMWDEFKSVTREFNHKKNEFYKSLKQEQQQNLAKKEELLKIAKEHADSKDWEKSVQIIKKIQSDWKKIGHVPRRQSDKIWKEFKEACNKFFDNYKGRSSQMTQEFVENLEQKEALLAELKEFKLSGERQEDLNKINEFNIRWSSIGKVPAAKMSIYGEFSKTVNELVNSLGLSEDEIQEFKLSALMDRIKSGQDEHMLDDEIRKTKKQVEELEKEINQLETNIGFFADENSPLLKNVYKQIEDKRNRLTDAEFKLRKLHRIDFDEEPKADEFAQNQKPDSGEEDETAEN